MSPLPFLLHRFRGQAPASLRPDEVSAPLSAWEVTNCQQAYHPPTQPQSLLAEDRRGRGDGIRVYQIRRPRPASLDRAVLRLPREPISRRRKVPVASCPSRTAMGELESNAMRRRVLIGPISRDLHVKDGNMGKRGKQSHAYRPTRAENCIGCLSFSRAFSFRYTHASRDCNLIIFLSRCEMRGMGQRRRERLGLLSYTSKYSRSPMIMKRYGISTQES